MKVKLRKHGYSAYRFIFIATCSIHIFMASKACFFSKVWLQPTLSATQLN